MIIRKEFNIKMLNGRKLCKIKMIGLRHFINGNTKRNLKIINFKFINLNHLSKSLLRINRKYQLTLTHNKTVYN